MKTGMLRKIFLRIVVLIPAIFMACLIFGFSAQNGSSSTGVSNRFIAMVFHTDNPEFIEKVEMPVRKLAHFTEYMIFSFTVYIALKVWQVSAKRIYFVTIILVGLFACSDEIHQLFVPERAGRIVDVIIDTMGAVAGMLIVRGIRKLRKVESVCADI